MFTELCLTLFDPMNCSPVGSSVHGIFPARKLEWVAISSSRGSSRPRDQTRVSCIGRWILCRSTTWEASTKSIVNHNSQLLNSFCGPGALPASSLVFTPNLQWGIAQPIYINNGSSESDVPKVPQQTHHRAGI